MSLELQSSRALLGALPTEEQYAKSLAFVSRNFPRTKVPKAFAGVTLDVTEQDLNDVLKSVKPQSSCGMPYGLLATSKAQLIELYPGELKAAIRARLEVLASRDLTGLSARELVQAFAVDPCRTFIKNEPHTQEKISSGRLRLISSRSVVDECVERLLFGLQNEAEILCHNTIPSKPGMGLSTDEQLADISAYVTAFRGEISSTDVSGWDWCVQGWQASHEADCRLMLNNGFGTVFETVARNCLHALFTSVFVTSDGNMFEQTRSGVMKSGSYLTSSTNSRLRASLSAMIGSSFAMTMGDDCVEERVAGASEAYLTLGFKVRDENLAGGFSFCSHLFKDGRAEPESVLKGLYRLLSSPYSRELYEEFLHVYRNSRELERSLKTVTESGWLSENHGKEEQL